MKMDWYFTVLKKYAVFTGRARRKEYWMFTLFNFIVGLVLTIVELVTKSFGITVLSYLYSFAVLLPGIAVTVRRLHDAGHSGWWIFIGLIPLIGAIVLLVMMVEDSEPDENRYGPNPKTGDDFSTKFSS
jgi:uncharacterized membrane protein YhaH (DUF805 family)